MPGIDISAITAYANFGGISLWGIIPVYGNSAHPGYPATPFPYKKNCSQLATILFIQGKAPYEGTALKRQAVSPLIEGTALIALEPGWYRIPG